MANATILPDLFFGQWARPNAGRPTLAAGLAASTTALELSFTSPLLDENGDAITKAVVIGITTANGYTEHFYIAAGDFDASGLSATATARGIRLSGLDFTTGDASLVVAHVADEKVFVAVEGVYEAILNAVLRGDTISTGGTGFTIGMGADSTITIRRNTDGTEKGFLRWNTTLDKVQYSNDGSAWTSIDDAVVGYLIKMSAADTTPGYGQAKFVGAGAVTLTLLNPGGNEQLEIRVDSINVDVTYNFAETTPIGGPVSTSSADTVENTVYNTLSTGGTEATFDAGAASDICSVNLQDNLWVEAYAVSSQAYAIVGSSDRNNVQSYGLAAGAGANTGGSISIAKVDSTRFILVYRKSTDNTVYAKVGSVDVSTKAITYGAEVSVGTQSAAAQGYTSVCLVDTDKIVVAFRDTGAANAGRARATTISGTTIAPFGTVQTFEAGATTNISVATAATDYAVVHFADAGDSNKGKGVLLVMTGTSIAPGSAVEIDANTSTSFVTKQITTGYILCTWIGGASTFVQARVARVVGITLDYPTAAIPVNGLAALTPSCTVIDTGTAFVGYEETASSDGKFNQIEITTLTTLTAGAQYSFNSTNNISSVSLSKVDGRDKFIVSFRDEADSNKGNAIIFQNYDNRSKCVGLATTAVAAAASGTVRSKGLLTGLSGLTAAAVTYLGVGATYTTTATTTGLQLGIAKDTTEIDIGVLYSQSVALLTTKGDLLSYTGSALARLPVGGSNKVLSTDSTESTGLKYTERPRLLTFSTTPSVISEPTSETTIVSFTVPANALGTGNMLEVDITMLATMSFGSSETLTLLGYYGGTAAGNRFVQAAFTSTNVTKISTVKLYLFGNATTSSQVGSIAPNWVETVSPSNVTYTLATIAIDSTVDQTFYFRMQTSNFSSWNTTLYGYSAKLIPA